MFEMLYVKASKRGDPNRVGDVMLYCVYDTQTGKSSWEYDMFWYAFMQTHGLHIYGTRPHSLSEKANCTAISNVKRGTARIKHLLKACKSVNDYSFIKYQIADTLALSAVKTMFQVRVSKENKGNVNQQRRRIIYNFYKESEDNWITDMEMVPSCNSLRLADILTGLCVVQDGILERKQWFK